MKINQKENFSSFEESRLIKTYLNDIDYKPLSKEEEFALARRMIKGDLNAKEKIIKSNLKFVVTIAKKYSKKGIPLLDLISEGNLGLLYAIEKYDPDKGYRFISYAVWWIKQFIIRSFFEQGKMIRLPFNRTLQFYKMKKIEKLIKENDSEREITTKEIAKKLNMKEQDVINIKKATQDYVSIYNPIPNTSGDITIEDTIIDRFDQQPEELYVKQSLKDNISKALKSLSEKERQIINLRFGLDNKDQLSLSQVAKIYNVSKERIRQIEKRAIKKLKHISKKINLEVYLAA